MKILLWTDGFWPCIGGIETQALHFIQAMQSLGDEYLVIAQKNNAEHQEQETFRGISIVRVDFNRLINESRVYKIDAMENQIKNIIDAYKPDLIHLNIAIGNVAFIFLFLQRMFTVPIILTLHSIRIEDGDVNLVTKKAIKNAAAICCVSNAVLQTLKLYLPEDAQRAVCIYNGLSFPDILPTPLEFKPPTLLCLGRLSVEKGFNFAIAAIARLRDQIPGICLKIAGEGPEHAALVNLVKILDAEDIVSFIGAVSFEDVPALINQATIVLMPSTEESFGLVALEAAQMQRPVIAANVGGLPEVVLDNETGILVPSRNVPALADAIKFLINNVSLAVTLGKNGRERARKQFTIKAVSAAYAQVYSSEFMRYHMQTAQTNME